MSIALCYTEVNLKKYVLYFSVYSGSDEALNVSVEKSSKIVCFSP